MAKRNSTPEPRSAKAKLFKTRQLKVRKGYYDHHFFPEKAYLARKPHAPVPWVQIKGYWLNQAGFTIGTQLSVQVEKGCIILKTQASSS